MSCPFTFTLPLAPYRYALLQLPSRNVTEAEWEQLIVLLRVMKPGLVLEDEVGDMPVAETLAERRPAGTSTAPSVVSEKEKPHG